MASNTPLPTFQRYLNGAPLPSSNRRSFRPLEKYLMFLVLFTVGLVFFGAFFYLPEFKTSASQTGSKIYEHIQKAPELFQAADDHLGGRIVRHDFNQPDPHVISDQERLRQKIFEDEQKKVLERPNIGINERASSSSSIINTILPQESPIKSSALAKLDGNSPVMFTVSDDEDPDPDIRMKRETVKKVCTNLYMHINFLKS